MPRLSTFLVMIVLLWALPAAALTQSLSATDAYKLLEEKRDVFLLDVRTFGEYMQTRLEGARLIPVEQVGRRLGDIPRDRPILLYCAVGSRSAQVARYLESKGFTDLYNMYGGIWAWRSRDYPVMTGTP